MIASETAPGRRWLAVFDLDGTLTYRDTLVQFLASFLRRHPRRYLGLWRLPLVAIEYAAGHRDRGRLKAGVIGTVMRGADRAVVDDCAEAFVNSLLPRHRLRPAALAVLEAHRAAGDHLILLSASPDLYVPRIGHALGFERTLCTEMEWRDGRLDGALRSANRRGAEKLHCLDWLRSQYPGLPVIAYGNSASDLDHMRHADRALLVNADAAARDLAARWGIAAADWS